MGCGISQADQKKARQVPEVRGPQREELTKKRDVAEDVLRSFIGILPPEQRPSSSSSRSRRTSRASTMSNSAVQYLRHNIGLGGKAATIGRAGIEQFRVSQSNFREKNQTLIIFDWDDTIFPTFWFKDKKRSSKNKKMRPEEAGGLEDLSNAVIELLQVSMEVGHAVLITNAKRPWVDICAWKIYRNYKLDKMLREIPILYATEFVDLTENSNDLDELRKTMEKEGHDSTPDRMTEENQQKMTAMLLTQTKAKAMKEALLAFYASYEGQSWKNVITLGDALFEHDAIKKVILERPADMQDKRCRVKTMKFLEGPSLEGIKDEVVIATRWLRKLAELDDDVDIELGKSLEDMIELDKVLGGKTEMKSERSEVSEGFASNGATSSANVTTDVALC